jgi:glycine cleavage system H lipoate-binding protein
MGTNTCITITGWLFKMELTKPEEMDALMDEAAYETFLKAGHE